MSERDTYEGRLKALAASTSHHSEEVAGLKSTADDLSRQVQSLLRQLAIRDDPSLANTAIDAPAPSEGDIITDHLLEFKSIRGLQEQNQKLLKLTRGLMAKLDAREIRRATADSDDIDTGATLDQATETISRLHSQLLEAQKKINDTARERDFFSKLLSKGEGLSWSTMTNGTSGLEDGVHQKSIMTLQAEIDIVRTRAEKEITEAKEQVRIKAEQVGVAEVEKAKADAKATLLDGMSLTLIGHFVEEAEQGRAATHTQHHDRPAEARLCVPRPAVQGPPERNRVCEQRTSSGELQQSEDRRSAK